MIKKNTHYDESEWPYYRNLINKKISKYFNKIIDDNNGKQVQIYIDECQQAYEEYNKFNWSLYKTLEFSLFFALLLIIPAFFVIRKLYIMNKEKNRLNDDYLTKNQKRIDGIAKIIKVINFTDVINICLKEINYEHKGPIPSNYSQVMKKYFPKNENNWLCNNEFENVSTSSWGVFNKKILVINQSKRICHFEDSLQAKLFYENSYVPMALFTKAENLNFKSHFNLSAGNLKDVDKNFKYVRLENATFNNNYSIIRDDEVEFRIFYTVSVQEYLVSKLKEYGKGSNLPEYYWWNKSGPFIYSNYVMETPFYDFNGKQFNFIKDIKFELNEILNVCAKIIRKIIFERFLSCNCITGLPIMMTENHKEIIQELDNGMIPNPNVSLGDDIYAQGVLNTIWNQKIIKNAYKTPMYVTKTISKEQLSNDLIITKVFVVAHYYRLVSSLYGTDYRSGNANDRRHYIYKSAKNSFYLYYLQYKTFAIYDNGNSDIGELENIIIKHNMQKRVKIKDDHIVFTSANDSQYEKIKELTLIIDDYFKNNVKNFD